jgi:signal transduction histidine kinase
MQIEHSDFQDQLVRGLTHRMNNILTLFHGYLGLLLENKNLDQLTVDGLAKIRDGAKAASELMARTHALVRPSTVVWREIDIADLIRFLRPHFDMYRGPNTKLDLDFADDVPLVRGDMGRIKTAIVELVHNACDATFPGGNIRINLRAERPAPSPSAATPPITWVSITVTDDGPGIAPEIKERVFTPFFTTKKKQHAAGLGLTVAANFVQQHGGVIRLESSPGQTVAELRLPSQPLQG